MLKLSGRLRSSSGSEALMLPRSHLDPAVFAGEFRAPKIAADFDQRANLEECLVYWYVRRC